MSVTPQTNATLERIASQLLKHDHFCICGHVSPDGDCLGSQLALAHALRSLGKDVTCLLARDDAIDPKLAFLPGASDMVFAGAFEGPCDVFVAVDVPTPERMGEHAAAIHAAAGLTVTVDHHAADVVMSHLSYTDPDAASTTMLVWELVGLMGCSREGNVATCAYVGLMTDTGRFQYQNADARAFARAAEMVEAGAAPAHCAQQFFANRRVASVRLESIATSRMRFLAGGQAVLSHITAADMASCGACKADAEPLIDALRSIEGVRVACMLREQDGGVRGSLRAKDDTDVAQVAREFGGGGHRAASGFSLDGPIERAVELAAGRLERLCAEGAAL